MSFSTPRRPTHRPPPPLTHAQAIDSEWTPAAAAAAAASSSHSRQGSQEDGALSARTPKSVSFGSARVVRSVSVMTPTHMLAPSSARLPSSSTAARPPMSFHRGSLSARARGSFGGGHGSGSLASASVAPRRTHSRQASSFGSSPLATELTLAASEPVMIISEPPPPTPLDAVPSLFNRVALERVSRERPYQADLAELLTALKQITLEESAEMTMEVAVPQPPPGAAALQSSSHSAHPSAPATVSMPNVSVGWSENRRVQAGETLLRLLSYADKLLLEHTVPSAARRLSSDPHMHPAPVANPLANLRKDFLAQREILSLVAACSGNENLPALAPSLIALSRKYQERLLALQAHDEVRLEIDLPEVKELPLSKRQISLQKQASIASSDASQPVRPGTSAVHRRGSSMSSTTPRRGGAHSRTPSVLAAASDALPPASPAAVFASPLSASSALLSSPSSSSSSTTASKFLRLENQGNPDVYLPWNLLKREQHLFHPDMIMLSKLFWRVCFVDGRGEVHMGNAVQTQSSQPLPKRLHAHEDDQADHSAPSQEGGLLVGLPRRTYIHLYSLIHFLLKPSYLPSYAQAVVAADWIADLGVDPSSASDPSEVQQAQRKLMTLPQFHLGLFNLVDTWTSGVSIEEYVSFLRTLFVFITEEVPDPSPPQRPVQTEFEQQQQAENPPPPVRPLPVALPSVKSGGSVFARRLKPLTIPTINNLRRLGLRGGSLQGCTLEMMDEIEARARETESRRLAALRAGQTAAIAEEGSPDLSRTSSSSSLLGSPRARTGRDEAEQQYTPSALSLSRGIGLANFLHSPPPAAAKMSATPTHRRKATQGIGVLVKPVPGAAAATTALRVVTSPTSGGMLSPANSAAQSERRPSSSLGAASAAGYSQPRLSLSSPTQPLSATTASPQASAHVHEDAATEDDDAIDATPEATAEDASAAEGDADGSEAADTVAALDDDEDAELRSVLAAASAIPLSPFSSPRSSSSRRPSRFSSPTTKTSNVAGALSWRRSSSAAQHAEEDRAMAEAFRAMQVEFDEIKAAAARGKEKDEAKRPKHMQLDDSDEEENREEEERRERKKRSKRARLAAAARARHAPPPASSGTNYLNEEKQQDLFNPFTTSHTRGGQIGAHALPAEDPALVAARAQRAATMAAAAEVSAFEQKRRDFQRESAVYLQRLSRLHDETQSKQQQQSSAHPSAHASLSARPPLLAESAGTAELRQLIQQQLMYSTPVRPSSAGAGRTSEFAPDASSTSQAQQRPSPLQQLASMTPQQRVAFLSQRPTSALHAAPASFRMLLSADTRADVDAQGERLWRLMPQGRRYDAAVARQEAKQGRSPADACHASTDGGCDCFYCKERVLMRPTALAFAQRPSAPRTPARRA